MSQRVVSPHRLLWRLLMSVALGALLPGSSADAQTLTADDLFNDGVLHEVRLYVYPRDWETLKANFQLNDHYPAHFVWNGQTLRQVGIRSRGVGSRSGVKPGLRVDFNRYDSTQTLLGLTSIVLRNNTQDPSSLHERLSMKLFAQMGIPAPRTAHTRLYVNDQYVGLYLIVEQIDRRFLARNFPESDGYLYNYQWASEYFFEYKGPAASLYTPSPFEPETHVNDPDPAPLVDMIRTINEAPADGFLAAVSAFVDVPGFVRQAAVENFLADNDGLLGYAGMNNFYLYRPRSSRVSTFIPWDKSEAFKGGPFHPLIWNIDDIPVSVRNRLMDRVMMIQEIRDLYFDTLLACAAFASADGWLDQEIRREYEQVRQAAVDDPVKPFTNDAFESDIQQLLEFARLRSAAVIQDVQRRR
ncbi:MAG TPA: CotH kinase family protein [Vicinamibacterales bacterium]|nr:CotH kinase family protein [Vicinamibacterales bacterium]